MRKTLVKCHLNTDNMVINVLIDKRKELLIYKIL